VYPENNREMLPKLYLRSEYNMETNPIYTYSGCPKRWTIQNRYGYRYAKICIFPTISLSNGKHLARLHDIRTSYRKRGVGCLTLLSCKVTSQGRWGMIFAVASPATKEYNSVNCKFWQHLSCTVREQKPTINQQHDGRQPRTQQYNTHQTIRSN